MKAILILLVIVLITDASAQQKDTLLIIPGGIELQTGKLASYSSVYDFFSIKEGTETKVGGLEDNFTIDKNGKDIQGLRVCKISFGANQILDSGLCQLKGLSPVYHRSIQTQKTLNLVFTKGAVQGSILKKNQPSSEIINYPAEVPLFDSFYEDIIAKSVNFTNRTVFKFPEYIYERGGTVWSLGQVTGSEKMKGLTGTSITVWTVQFSELDKEKKIVRTTIYKISDSDRGILSREYILASNRIVMRKRAA